VSCFLTPDLEAQITSGVKTPEDPGVFGTAEAVP
jgi:hypothetical protein